jgi:RNA polymerase sigma factor (sigma-70 family)
MTDEDAHARTLVALQSLPAPLRKILQLREVEGLPMEEAARRLGLSRQAAERRWTRAIVLMTKRLEKIEVGRTNPTPRQTLRVNPGLSSR